MALTPRPPREGAPIMIASIGPQRGSDGGSTESVSSVTGRWIDPLLDDEQFTTTGYENVATLLDAVEDGQPGPDCILLDDADPGSDPLLIAARIDDRCPDLPVVLCTSTADAYDTQDVLDAGIDTLLTPSDLDDSDSVRESVADCALAYRQRVADRQDASLLETMLERLPVHAFAKDREGQYVRASDALYEPSQLLGRTDFDIWPEREPGDHGHETLEQVLDNGDAIHNEAEFCTVEDGWFLVSKVPWVDDEEIVGLAGLAIDITDRKQREEELQATTQLLSTIVQTSPAAIVVHDTAGTVQFWNPAAAELFGWSADEAIREPYPPYVTEETREEFHEMVASVLEDGSIGLREVRRKRRDGQWLDLQLSAVALDEDGDSSRIVSVLTDVTDLKERERRLKRQNDRIEQFTRVLAHDLRNPVQVIRGQLDHGDAHDRALVERALNRIEAIVDDVLAVARSEPLVTETTSISLDSVATDVWEHTNSEGVTLRVESNCKLAANRARLHRLLDHLVENAVEHGGDTITVGCLEDGFYVADDGDGIAPEHRDRVFEPGYSTEPTATGFGLNVVREITEAHEWTVELCETDTGARFEIHDVDRLDG